MKKAIVIIPTIGNPDLIYAINSVLNQSYKETYCLIVVDGAKFSLQVSRLLGDNWIEVDEEKLFRCDLPFNTGGGGFYGQRIMTSFAYLVDFDYVFYLDQDTWFEQNHVESIIETIETNHYDWAFSLRKIFTKEGKYLCNDDCESLGKWPIWHSNDQYLVDNNCYCFTKNFLLKIAPLMYGGWGADRELLRQIRNKSWFGCTGLYTVDYRLGGNAGSVKPEFFLEGNRKMREKYSLTGFPWSKENRLIELTFDK